MAEWDEDSRLTSTAELKLLLWGCFSENCEDRVIHRVAVFDDTADPCWQLDWLPSPAKVWNDASFIEGISVMTVTGGITRLENSSEPPAEHF